MTSDGSIFFFLQSFFWRKVHLISFFFVLYIVFQLRYFWWSYFLNIFSVLDSLLRLVCLPTSSSTCNNTNNLYIIFTCYTNQFLLLNTFSFHFSQTLLLANSISLSFDPESSVKSLCHSLTWFRVFGCFLQLPGCCECWFPWMS